MRFAGHVARMVDIRNSYGILVGKPEEKRPMEDLGVYSKIILEWILGKQGGKVWIGFMWLSIETSGGLLLALC
jgi:hypothetical protein